MQNLRQFDSELLDKLSLVVARSLVFLLAVGLLANIYRAVSDDINQSYLLVRIILFAVLLMLCFRSSKVSAQLRFKVIIALAVGAAFSGVLANQGFSYTSYTFLLFASGLLALVAQLRTALTFSLFWTFALTFSVQFSAEAPLLRLVAQFWAVFGLSAVLIYTLSEMLRHLRSGLNTERQLRQDLDAEQQRLKEKQEQLALVAEAGDIGLFEQVLEDPQVYVSRKILERIGIDADESIVPVEQFLGSIPEQAQPAYIAEAGKVARLSSGESFSFTHPQYHADGSLRTIRVKGVVVERHGRLIALGSAVDISSEERALETAQTLASNLEAVSQAGGIGVIEFYPQTGMMEVNAEVCRRLGRAASDNRFPVSEYRKHLVSDDPDAQRSALNEALSQLPPGAVQRFEEVIHTADGKTLHLRIARMRFVSEGQERIVGVSIDVTAEHEAAERAQHQAAQLSVLTEQGKIGLYEFDLEHEVIYANSVICERMGLAPDAGSFNQEVLINSMPVESRARAIAQIERGKRREAIDFQTSTVDQYYPDGSLHKIRIYEQLVERDGRPFFVGASVDVTDEVAALEVAEHALLESQEKERLLNLAYSVTDLAVAELDVETNNLRLIAGSGPNTALFDGGVDFWSFYTPVYGAKAARQIYDMFDRPGASLVLQGKVKGIPDHWAKVACSAEYMRNGRRYRSISRLIVNELVEARHEAEMKERELRNQQERQAQMYAVIGHELRTPAASLQMMLEDLEEGEALNSDLVGANIEQLLSVIDTLRAVAQPDRIAKAAYANVHLDEMLLQQAEVLTPLAQRNAVQLRTDLSGLTSHPVRIQKTLLCQVVANLVKNALIHSGGSQIRLGASGELVDVGRKRIRIWVADNGKGVPADKVEELFEAFVRGSTEAEGTGLGLHICREIIHNMGGSLRYETAELGGASFVIELEVELADVELASGEDAGAQVSESQSPLQGLRVLMAEDNKTIQMLTQKMLTKQGAQVQVCDNGAEALAAYKPGSFDLVLSDIFMPQMNGYEFVAALREQGYRGRVIGLTAATIGEETDKMLASGADAVLSKPINMAALNAELAADAVDE